jgi:TolB protein
MHRPSSRAPSAPRASSRIRNGAAPKALAGALALALLVAAPGARVPGASLLAGGLALGQDRGAPDAGLPSRGPVIDIDSPERALYKIAVPSLLGDASLGAPAAEVLRNDFRLVSLFEVLDPRSFVADPAREGLSITPASWTSVGAQGVVKGEITGTGSSLVVEMRLFEVARGATATLSRTYRGGSGELRGFMHDFANEVLRVLTGEAGAFGSRLLFARRVGPGRKDVYVADFDGHGVGRISSGRGVAMLPAFGPGGIWYSILTRDGMFITRTNRNEEPIITGGMNMGVTACGNRLLFSSTRDGNSEIYSAAADGTDVRRLTNHPAIDVSPTCGPGGLVAFVSDRNGGPQIFVMDVNGGGVRRVTFRGNHNQTPAWCPQAGKSLIAFTGRDAGMDVFTVDINTQQYTRLTQGQGVNKDPAFSPDCRMVAFWSSRGGVFLSNPEGLNQTKVIDGPAETIRWSR